MDIQETKVEDNWTDSDIKVAGDLNKDVKTNVVPKEKKEGEEDQDQEYTEIVETEELTEEELEIQRIEQENQQINDNYDAYVELDTAAETAKLQAKEMAKNKKKAEIHLLEPRGRISDNRGFVNKGPCGGTEKGMTHFMANAGSKNYIQWKTLKTH